MKMTYSAGVNFVRMKLFIQNWENLTPRTKFTTLEIKKLKNFPCGSVRNITSSSSYNKKPNYVHNVISLNQNCFYFNLGKVSINSVRKHSTNNDSQEEKPSELDIKLHTYINNDLILSILSICFLWYDYKKYKEKGRGILFR